MTLILLSITLVGVGLYATHLIFKIKAMEKLFAETLTVVFGEDYHAAFVAVHKATINLTESIEHDKD